VESRKVTVGAAVGRKVVVQSGVKQGETVVTDGQLRLFPGAHIQPVAADKVDSQAL
jgi:multidrug efflux pump subunit AcrA (membrane-fusion protein)